MTQQIELDIAKARYERSPKRRADWIRYCASAEAIRRFWRS